MRDLMYNVWSEPKTVKPKYKGGHGRECKILCVWHSRQKLNARCSENYDEPWWFSAQERKTKSDRFTWGVRTLPQVAWELLWELFRPHEMTANYYKLTRLLHEDRKEQCKWRVWGLEKLLWSLLFKTWKCSTRKTRSLWKCGSIEPGRTLCEVPEDP